MPATRWRGMGNLLDRVFGAPRYTSDGAVRIQQVVVDSMAVDPTSTLEACSLMEKKLVVAPPKP